jgi:regulator of extracellular matrix RemA (YlzA/DUF370 family)
MDTALLDKQHRAISFASYRKFVPVHEHRSEIHIRGRLIPEVRMFTKIHRNLGERGMFVSATHDRRIPRAVSTPDLDNIILTHVANNPSKRTVWIATVEGFPRTVGKSFTSSACNDIHPQLRQCLRPDDCPERIHF